MAIDIQKNYMDKHQTAIATYTSLKMSSAATMSLIVVHFYSRRGAWICMPCFAEIRRIVLVRYQTSDIDRCSDSCVV